MPGFREFLESPKGRYAGIAVITLGLAAAGYSIYSNVGESAVVDMTTHRPFIDAKTGKLFYVDMTAGVGVPTRAPSGGDTGYPPELCYWTKDGKIKSEPTYVLLNTYKGLPEPTFCPDCGRLVRGHNPTAFPNSKPPPTKAEYEAAHQK
jgi:hypothetical protein